MGSHRRTAAAAIATLLAAISLYPLFIGTAWFWAGAGAAVTVAAAGTLTRLRRLPATVCLAAGAVALLVYLNLAFEAGRSLGHLLPTPASLHLLASLAAGGTAESSRYAPPVPELPGMMLLASGAIGIVALLTDLIAVRLRSAALAGLPLLLLVMEPFTVNAYHSGLGTVIVFCLAAVGYLGLLGSEGRDRIRKWEQPRPAADVMPDTAALSAAGRRVGIASMVIALCLPLFIPGLHTTRLFGGSPGIGGHPGSGGSGGASLPAPETMVSSQLRESRAQPVLTYASSAADPGYFRLYVLDDLTTSGWTMSARPSGTMPASPRLPLPPGLTEISAATSVTTAIAISPGISSTAVVNGRNASVLPVPYPPVRVSAPGTWRADADRMVFSDDTSLSGLRYTVTSLEVSPTAQQGQAAPPPARGIASSYLEVPRSYASLLPVAQDITAGAANKFAMAVALQNWLSGQGGFKYTLNAPTVTSAASLTDFLQNTRRGYCQQFAVAMATLARLLGIPARVAIGYTSGKAAGHGAYLVTTHDAHEWPELYFQGFGWLRFEPTPSGPDGQGTATTPSYAVTLSGPGQQPGPLPLPGTSATAPASRAGQLPPGDRIGLPPGGGAGPGGGAPPARLTPWEIFGLAVAALLGIACAAPSAARLVIRRGRWRRAARGGDAGLARAAWRELRDVLADYRATCRPSESPRALASRIRTQLRLAGPAADALDRVTMAAERAFYATRPVPGAGLRHDSAVLRRAIAAATPRRTRWRALVLPSSVLAPAGIAVSQVADIFGRMRLTRLPGAASDGR